MVGLKLLPIRRYEREGRRRLGAEWEDALYPGLGTHYAYLEVGSPDAQRVSVIIDTGSSLTAFPCTACTNCGTHTDAVFDPEASSSFEWLTCDQCKGGATCASSGRCQASQSYAEGSTWQAQLALDRVSIDGALVEGFVFGCITSEDGLFVSQIADGIMGMSAHSSIASQLVMQGLTTSRAFSLCFAKEGGTMVLGGADEARRDGPMQFTSLLHSMRSWYTVGLLDVEINGVSIGSSADVYGEGMGTIIDSGTTDTYLPHKVASAFESTWRKATGFSFDSAHYVEQAIFPTLTFVFHDGLRVDVEPSAYVEQDSQRRKVPRLYFTQQSGAVLGASFMQNHDVLFDLDNNRIGIAPSSRCVAETEAMLSSMPTLMPTSIPNKLLNRAEAMLSSKPTLMPTSIPTELPNRTEAMLSSMPTLMPTSIPTKLPNRTQHSTPANKKKSGSRSGAVALDATSAAAAALIALLLLFWLTLRCRRRSAGPQFARLPTDINPTADSPEVDIQLGTPPPQKKLSWIWIVKQDHGVGQSEFVQSPLNTPEDDEKNCR